jgi:hypothetical protein
MVLNFVTGITSVEPTVKFKLISWSIEAFATRSEKGSKESNGARLFIFQAVDCRKRGQFSERAKTRKLPLAQ